MTRQTSTFHLPDGTFIRAVLALVMLLLGAMLTSGWANVQPLTPAEQDAFVERVSTIAVREQARTAVPASITAAQAVLESNWGRAHIAREGNNYFGIKCKSWWTGATVYQKDDDYDESGLLTESCFRAYKSVEESFRDHSDFLTSSERYAVLFDLEATDYKAWAKGLRKCGYATDPAYAEKLIGIIERLGFASLDMQAVAPFYDDAFEDEMDSVDAGKGLQEELASINAQLRSLPPANRSIIPATYKPTGRGKEAALRSDENAPEE